MKELEIFPGTNSAREKREAEMRQKQLQSLRYNQKTYGKSKKSGKPKKENVKNKIKFYVGCAIIATVISTVIFSNAVNKQYEENLNNAGYELEYIAVGSSELDQAIFDSEGNYINKKDPNLPTRAEAIEDVIDNIFTPGGR